MSRVVVTGAAGFVGRHLLAELRAAGAAPVAWVRRRADLGACDQVTVDLTHEAATTATLTALQPAVVYHLAAASSPAMALRDPVACLRDNVLGTASLLRACAACTPRPRVLLVTSSELYGAPAGDQPLDEQTPPAPRHAYAVSKLAQSDLGRQAAAAGLDVVEARPFNHCGPGQRLGFVVPDFASRLAAIRAGRAEAVMQVGDLTAGRDFSDVRDIVRGYVALAAGGQSGEAYNLCRGEATTAGELLATLLELAGVTVEVQQDPSRLRPGPVSQVTGSAAKAHAAVGWEPRLPLRQTLADVLDEWLARLA